MESFWVQAAIGAIKCVAFVCDVLTFPIYLVLQKPWRRRALSKRIKVRKKIPYFFQLVTSSSSIGLSIDKP